MDGYYICIYKWMMTGGSPISGNLHIYIYLYPLVIADIAIENRPVEIVDLPIENGGSIHSYVSLPEGKYKYIYIYVTWYLSLVSK